MNVFSAIADPTRRSILELIAKNGPMPAAEIAGHYHLSAPAISQHLKALREANLVAVEKRAQQRIYHINRDAFRELEDWAAHMTQVWNQRFDALEKLIEAEKQKTSQADRKDEEK